MQLKHLLTEQEYIIYTRRKEIIEFKTWRNKEEKRIRELYKQNLAKNSLTAIGKEFGMSKQAIEQKYKQIYNKIYNFKQKGIGIEI